MGNVFRGKPLPKGNPSVTAPYTTGKNRGAGAASEQSVPTVREIVRSQKGTPRTVLIYPPEVFPIPDAIEFNPSGTQATAAVETGTIVLAPLIQSGAMQLPPLNVGVIRSFTISITNMLTTTDVTFSLLINGATAGGYGNIRMTPRAAPYVSNAFDCTLRLPQNAKLSVVFSNNDGGTYVLGASFGGWYWPDASGKRWMAGGY